MNKWEKIVVVVALLTIICFVVFMVETIAYQNYSNSQKNTSNPNYFPQPSPYAQHGELSQNQAPINNP
jgi:hypothetical protein